MKKIILFSILLVCGLALSQIVPGLEGLNVEAYAHIIKILTMIALGFIMIHVGCEFGINKSHINQYAKDYLIAATAAAFPWIFCALYFAILLSSSGPGQWESWKESFLTARFASPTSAGILFSMLIAAGLSTTWVFRKVRILAIFDDLDTVLFMIPLQMMIVGLRWQLVAIVILMILQLWMAWHFLHKVKIPVTWPWVIAYSTGITIICEFIYIISKIFHEVVPIHIEILLPAFVLGCMIARPIGGLYGTRKIEDIDEENPHNEAFDTVNEKRAATIVSCIFMLLVGLTMPPIARTARAPEPQIQMEESMAVYHASESIDNPDNTCSPINTTVTGMSMSWKMIFLHVIAITLLSNLGKMFPALCYRKEVPRQERLAIAIALFPRGEVGAGVLIISISYSIGGAMITVAILSLALNLLCTGIFIVLIKRLIGNNPTMAKNV